MAIFNFKQTNRLKVTIGEVDFFINASDPSILAGIEKYSIQAQKLGKELQGSNNDTEAILTMLEFLKDYIELILGDGACEKIFTDTKMNIYDSLDLIHFLLDEIGKFNNKKLQGYIKE